MKNTLAALFLLLGTFFTNGHTMDIKLPFNESGGVGGPRIGETYTLKAIWVTLADGENKQISGYNNKIFRVTECCTIDENGDDVVVGILLLPCDHVSGDCRGRGTQLGSGFHKGVMIGVDKLGILADLTHTYSVGYYAQVVLADGKRKTLSGYRDVTFEVKKISEDNNNRIVAMGTLRIPCDHITGDCSDRGTTPAAGTHIGAKIRVDELGEYLGSGSFIWPH